MSVENNETQDDFRSRPRWSAIHRIDVVLRLFGGRVPRDVSREVGVEAHRLAAWRDDFLESCKAGLNAKRPGAESDQRLAEAERKIGESPMENEILRRAADKRGLRIPTADATEIASPGAAIGVAGVVLLSRCRRAHPLRDMK